MGIPVRIVSWGMGETVFEGREGMGTTGQTVERENSKLWSTPYGGTGNSRDGNDMPSGTVDGRNRDQRREDVGESRSGAKYGGIPVPVPFRSSPDHIFPTRPLPRVPLENSDPP